MPSTQPAPGTGQVEWMWRAEPRIAQRLGGRPRVGVIMDETWELRPKGFVKVLLTEKDDIGVWCQSVCIG